VEATLVGFLNGLSSKIFWFAAVAFVLVNGAAVVAFGLTKSRRLVNEWTGKLVVLDAVLIGAGLGVPLAALFEVERAAPGPLVRRGEQPEWRDPGSGYLRRNVSPPDYPAPMRIVEVEFPASRRVVLEGAGAHAVIHQQVWVLDGAMELTHGGVTQRLEAGDCLAMRLDGPVEFRNPTRKPARYAVVIANEPARPARK